MIYKFRSLVKPPRTRRQFVMLFLNYGFSPQHGSVNKGSRPLCPSGRDRLVAPGHDCWCAVSDVKPLKRRASGEETVTKLALN